MIKKTIVVLSGAGISAESGLQTFRDSDGLWEDHRVEDVATPQAFNKNPKMVLDFYNYRRKNVANVEPNAAHFGLAALEKEFNVQIITQNIDDLHERAGSTEVYHLHGEIFKMRSINNEQLILPNYEDIKLGDLAPDGHQLRPHIVWFGEAVPMIETVLPFVEKADIFIVIGTSLQVYPAAGLLDYVTPNIPIYVVDKKIPNLSKNRNITLIEAPATKGIDLLIEKLKA
ncbi:MAG TPA: NAD-dependent deacylase [Edaphocola sp.]|nr:NAD-dependent deacylase [Edaphocola sp.]